MEKEKIIEELDGVNMDIDLTTESKSISWGQDKCFWNKKENTNKHRCAVKNISICPYFCGIKYLDNILCCYPHKNPNEGNE